MTREIPLGEGFELVVTFGKGGRDNLVKIRDSDGRLIDDKTFTANFWRGQRKEKAFKEWLNGELEKTDRGSLSDSEFKDVKLEISRVFEDRREGGVCVSRLLDGVSGDERSDALFKLAVFMKRSGASKDWAKEVLKGRWNKRNDPPLPERELDRTIESAYKGPRRSESEDYSLYFDRDPDRYEIVLSAEDGEEVPVVQPKEREAEEGEEESKLDKLIGIGLDATEEFIVDSVTDDVFAVVEGGGHLETRPLEGNFMRDFLASEFYERERKGVSETAVRSAINTLRGFARRNADARELFVRVGEHDGSIYYDLCDDKWRAVEISEDGWKVVEDPPSIFMRWGHQEEQVEPSEDGDMELFRGFLTLSEKDWKVIKPIIPTMLVLDFPHFILVFKGAHGSTKSFAMRLIRDLVDPSSVGLLAEPKTPDDAIVTLSSTYVGFFDNLQELDDWFIDILCRASTGEGYMKRELYTDREQAPFAYRRCVGFNTIASLPSRADLLDRSVIFELESIDDSERKSEETLLSDFREKKPKILAGMFDALSEAIKIRPHVKREIEESEKLRTPRMADAAVWAESVARAMGYDKWEWLSLYNEKVGQKETFVLERNPIGMAVIALMRDRRKYESSPKKLLEKLEEVAEENEIDTKHEKWPKNARWLTSRLEEVEADLSKYGIEIGRGWKGSKRIIQIFSEGSVGSVGDLKEFIYKRLKSTDATDATDAKTSTSLEKPRGEGGDGDDDGGTGEGAGLEKFEKAIESARKIHPWIDELDVPARKCVTALRAINRATMEEDPAPIELVRKKMRRWWNPNEFRKIVDKAVEEGDLYEPAPGCFSFGKKDLHVGTVEKIGEERHACEECKKLGIEDKPATGKYRVQGREVWLCDDCARSAGFKEG